MSFVLPSESEYSVIRKIGSGASGTVYLIQNDEGNKYALKVFKDENDEAIQKEIECLERVNEICGDEIYCYKEVMYITYNGTERKAIVMEYLEGYTELFKYITHRTTMAQLEEIRDKTIKGFIKLAEHGIAHNDPNSTNILVKMLPDGTQSVKIIDFGKCSTRDNDNDIEETMRSLVLTFALTLFDMMDYETEFLPFFAPFYDVLPSYGIDQFDLDDILSIRNLTDSY